MDASPSTKPKSWAEDLNSYRDTRGSRAFGTLNQTEVPKRFCRTNLPPFGDNRHPLAPYDVWRDGAGKVKVDPDVQADRTARHGWGDTSLIKQEGFEPGTLHRSTKPPAGSGRQRAQSPRAKDGRKDMFEVIQQTSPGGADSWIGNPLIDPSMGKQATPAPTDPKGRHDLFDVLHCRNPGKPADDSWMGHAKIDPARGKGHPMGPEELRGRKDLTDVLHQTILRETEHRRHELMQRGADPLSDGWIGHPEINPAKGKAPVYGVAAGEDVMHGATFKHMPEGHSDFPRPHTMMVPPPVSDVMRQVLDGSQSGKADWSRTGRRVLPEPQGDTRLPRENNLYSNMTYKDLSAKETTHLGRSLDDSRMSARRPIHPQPGATEHGKGADMLHWKPHDTLGSFVPYGKLAQQTRSKRR